MNIFNVRKGFATNSSSSHSVIEMKEKNGKFGVYTDEYQDFGWNFFTAADKESKENYVASLAYQNLRQIMKSDTKAKKELENIFGKDVAKRGITASIDHQSVLTLPRTWDNKNLNIEFLKDFIQYIQQEKVVIVGGNDNTDEEHSLIEKDHSNISKVNLERESSNDHYVARKDKDYWTVFNRTNGEKVRFSFISSEAPTKATSPELADIKITDFCPYDCDFCYQDSTIKGQHAKIEDIKKISKELSAKNVFEVALGGGETTLHPNFVEILKIFKEENIVPNFTTKNLNLLRQSNAKEIIESCGAMAFSVQSKEEILKVKSAFIDFEEQDKITTSMYDYYSSNDKRSSPWKPKITFQIVMGVMPEKEFISMLDEISDFGARVTLLGYKENGRGSSFAPFDYNNWLDIVLAKKEKSGMIVSIDTALAAEFEKELLSKEIDSKSFHTNEGAFSVYIDAVKMKFYPSSYVGLENSKTFDENWLDGYADMNVKPSVKKSIKIGKV